MEEIKHKLKEIVFQSGHFDSTVLARMASASVNVIHF